uniref:Uncharacterized protein n=1 Tax=Oryza punctata TaxID=4537 RepID=A0A0E0M751_ORYPU
MEITRSEVLRPSPASASGSVQTAKLTAFDRAATDGHIPTVFAWNTGAPSNDKIKDGLAAVLARFPHLAGRFDVDDRGRRCVRLNDAGVLVLEAAAAADLADALAHDDVAAHVNDLYPKADMGRADEPVLQVQLTRYTCGGLVIGTACHHQVADGQSMSVFYTAWAAAVRTAGAVLPTPSVDRAAVAAPRSPPTPAFDHRNIEFKGDHSRGHSYGVLPLERIRNLAVHFPEEFVSGLKSQVGARCSTFQCLLAHAWKKVTAARDLSPEEFTQVRVAVNCRGRASPAVPVDYFGNMVLWAFPRMQVRDLLSASYAAVVGVIRDAVARVDEEYIQSFVDFGELAIGGGHRHGVLPGPGGGQLARVQVPRPRLRRRAAVRVLAAGPARRGGPHLRAVVGGEGRRRDVHGARRRSRRGFQADLLLHGLITTRNINYIACVLYVK